MIAALFRDGTSRKLLLDNNALFFAPEELLEELASHRKMILERSGLAPDDLEIAIVFLLSRIRIVPSSHYSHLLEEVLIHDEKDRPFLALALALKIDGIWTHDKDFFEQRTVRIFTNNDLLRLLEKIK